jgi:IS30 family transposase
MTRSERGMIRILHDRGFDKAQIAQVVGCTTATVTNILARSTLNAARDNPIEDYEHVTEAFKAKYPPPSASHLKKPVSESVP